MSTSVEEIKKIINEDIKEKYGKLVKFEISSAILGKVYADDLFKSWKVRGHFSYEITNRTLRVGFEYWAEDDDKKIWERKFCPA
jgi:hypothetical protein